MNENLPSYKPVQPIDPVAKSIERESAFSKPGTTKSSAKSKGWAPAKGLRFRATNEKRPGRRRIHPQDKRRVTFY